MFNISRSPMYDEDSVQPMRDELVAVGFEELRDAKSVADTIDVKDDKTILVMINSVCGCAAGGARPGVSLALQNDVIPDKIATVFAGQDGDAVDELRKRITNMPPSSPSIALFKNGEVIFFLPRHEIEGFGPTEIAQKLVTVFNKACTRKGPSVPKEQYDKVLSAKACGSKIPLYQQ
ncbi:MAG: BrxA/BrxB family bacilliredoxin [Chlorobiaceae bacterium]|nr:BrxA/BrxB family bacilliredoxin [Chlorobiaceae bacterium]MBA4310548.1 BrxA/BrxB family bacilliredoxin [Chlorobiaceae bacterium]